MMGILISNLWFSVYFSNCVLNLRGSSKLAENIVNVTKTAELSRFIFKPLTHHHTNFDWLLPSNLILIGQDVLEEISTGSFRDVMLCCRET